MPIERFSAQVDMIKDLTHDVRQLDLRLIEPKTIVFKPGQFISFEMPHPRTGHLVTRAYSIASQPSRSDVITLLFNLVPGGPGSGLLFHLNIGEKTHFKGPAGNFYLREDQGRELLFIASGTGIAPIRSMLLANAERRDLRPATLFWGLRSQRDLYYQEELVDLIGRTPTLTAITTLSRPEPGWSGESGRVLRLIENMTLGRNAVGYLTESMHGAGSPQAQRIEIGRAMQLEYKKRLARALAGVEPELRDDAVLEEMTGYLGRVFKLPATVS
jgi:NAD(P)H-flavin reductase